MKIAGMEIVAFSKPVFVKARTRWLAVLGLLAGFGLRLQRVAPAIVGMQWLPLLAALQSKCLAKAPSALAAFFEPGFVVAPVLLKAGLTALETKLAAVLVLQQVMPVKPMGAISAARLQPVLLFVVAEVKMRPHP